MNNMLIRITRFSVFVCERSETIKWPLCDEMEWISHTVVNARTRWRQEDVLLLEPRVSGLFDRS